ncbi:hypothetical protein HZP42_00870 [Elizabethkingia anophelis]|nr:hypothetical protein [Elizabethkingia anophelis]MCT4234929.1 hypothetical protein [Elizabethkingia anophelis]
MEWFGDGYKEFSSRNDQKLSIFFTVNTSIPVKNPRREHYIYCCQN